MIKNTVSHKLNQVDDDEDTESESQDFDGRFRFKEVDDDELRYLKNYKPPPKTVLGKS